MTIVELDYSKENKAKASKNISNVYFSNAKIVILNDDILAASLIPNNSVDLVITSPPYNVNIDYSLHKDDSSYEEYLDFSAKWLKKCLDLTKEEFIDWTNGIWTFQGESCILAIN
ncbi:hypothetical protein HYY70_02945 [Candidatus Woesearchaeota archaeon]|nr:hypothetical protein [Candidatus Woesearchaeota archaeon]